MKNNTYNTYNTRRTCNRYSRLIVNNMNNMNNINPEQQTTTKQYIKDKLGNLHDLNGNVNLKLESVKKTREYWRAELDKDSTKTRAKKFFNNFDHLYKQIMLYISNKESLKV